MSLLVFFVLTVFLLYITFEVSNKDILSPGGTAAVGIFGCCDIWNI